MNNRVESMGFIREKNINYVNSSISEKNNTTENLKKWLFQSNHNTNIKLRLFCFPYAGGGISIYNQWVKEFPAEIEICAIKLPGRETRINEIPYKKLVPLVKNLTKVLKPLLNKPFAFFGHSMGISICYELARQLRREKLPGPKHLFLSGSRPPHRPNPDPNPIHYKMSDHEFISKLVEINGLPEEVLKNSELLQLFLPILRADIEMINTFEFKHEDPVDCPITSFGGVSDPKVSADDIAAWYKYTSNDFNYYMLDGDHFFLNDSRKQLCRIILHKLSFSLT